MANVSAATVLGLKASFGFGDRTGLATPGHVAAWQEAGAGVLPIFAQQSIREMGRTERSPTDVMFDAHRGMAQAGYTGMHGADADHLKTPADVDRTATAGFTFFTIDPSDDVDPHADGYSPAELDQKFAQVCGEIGWMEKYAGKTVKLKTGTVIDLGAAAKRAAVKYGRAINRTIKLAAHIDAVNQQIGRDYEIELSVDETPEPTTLAEHWIIAQQILSAGVKLVSLASLAYVGDFEKGVDYKGDVAAFERSLADHVAVMEELGPYKLSLHSGSDKLSIYGSFARITKGRWHVKTAGTSYLELLRVVARHDEKLFRELIDFARSRYDVDKATYHVSAEASRVPAPSDVKDARELERLYLERWEDVRPGRGFTQPGRQILHCTFGSTLTHPTYKTAIRNVVTAHPETYREVLQDHFARHLRALAGK